MCRTSRDDQPRPELMLPDYNPKLITSYRPLNVRENVFYIELYDHHALAIPDFFKGKMACAYFNDGTNNNISERELEAALASQKITVEQAQKEIEAAREKKRE